MENIFKKLVLSEISTKQISIFKEFTIFSNFVLNTKYVILFVVYKVNNKRRRKYSYSKQNF